MVEIADAVESARQRALPATGPGPGPGDTRTRLISGAAWTPTSPNWRGCSTISTAPARTGRTS